MFVGTPMMVICWYIGAYNGSDQFFTWDMVWKYFVRDWLNVSQ